VLVRLPGSGSNLPPEGSRSPLATEGRPIERGLGRLALHVVGDAENDAPGLPEPERAWIEYLACSGKSLSGRTRRY
jgi:hypothetical protein